MRVFVLRNKCQLSSSSQEKRVQKEEGDRKKQRKLFNENAGQHIIKLSRWKCGNVLIKATREP